MGTHASRDRTLEGTARKVVTRILHRLEQEGIVEGRRGELIIKDLERLGERTWPPE